MSSWSDLFVPALVLRSLQELQFTAPTPVQALCLPPAIRDHLDIVAAAETVSHHVVMLACFIAECLFTYIGCNKLIFL